MLYSAFVSTLAQSPRVILNSKAVPSVPSRAISNVPSKLSFNIKLESPGFHVLKSPEIKTESSTGVKYCGTVVT